jgi:tetratricopeptide (TPR) repeat protein
MIIDGRIFLLAIGLTLVLACHSARIPPPMEPAPSETHGIEPVPSSPERVEDELLRRKQVADALTEKGRLRLKAGQVDAAIRLFEKALSQSPRFGPGYYYLAEAWLTKPNVTQAQAFHDQAALYLGEQPDWRRRVADQQRRIENKRAEYVIP